MDWLNTLEAKFGRHAIHGLIRIVVGFNALVFVLSLVNPDFLKLLYFDRELILQGQVWRLVTYIFIPSLGRWWLMPDYLWLVFWLMFIWMLGDGLEQAWGAFKLNVFYFTGMIGTTIAAFFFDTNFNNALLNLSLLFAFATLYPDFSIMIFFFLPVKIKWIAWVAFGSLVLSLLGGPLSLRMAILASLGNYILFFGPTLFATVRHRHTVAARRREFESKAAPETESLHRCAACHKTELTNPELEFRVAKDGNEYCVAHLPGRVRTGAIPLQ